MPRLLFEKKGNAVWISHLDLMRLFQRSFKRAGLLLKHSQGYNPRPYVAVALPLSVGVESACELLDFDLEGDFVSNEQILAGLNNALTEGIRVLDVYSEGSKIKHLAYLDCVVTLMYDNGVPAGARDEIEQMFRQTQLVVSKKSKNGPTEQDIIPMIRHMEVEEQNKEILLRARVCCQNPSLNPMQLSAAVARYLPQYTPDHAKSCRIEIFDTEEKVFR